MARDPAMDTARGIAVAGMIFMHFVPLDSFPEIVQTFLEGTAAALFFILIGMSWAIQADRAKSWTQLVLRRSLALIILGVFVHLFLWPTEVLVPFGIMLGPALYIRSRGTKALFASILVLLAATVIGAEWFSQLSEADWLESGAHVADSTFGWATLRYLLVDGNYPLVPWLAFPLLGMLLQGRAEKNPRRLFGLSITLGIGVLLFTVAMTNYGFGPSVKPLVVSWVPTTLPFMLMKGGFAVAILAGLVWWQAKSGLPSRLASLSAMGRASLTHYLGHILIVFAPLRLLFPNEDWSLGIGLAAFAGYLLLALPLSLWWFRLHKRGPLEQALAYASGAKR